MSAATITNRRKTAKNAAPAPQAAPTMLAPASPMAEIDQLLQPIANHLGALIRPFVDAWPWEGQFPGKTALLAADEALMDLAKVPSAWEEARQQRPLTARLLENVHRNLRDALTEIEAATDFDAGQRRLLLVVVREACAQDKALGQAFGEACLSKRYGPLRDMAAGAGGEPITHETFEVTGDTPLLRAGEAGAKLVLWCSYDIEHLAEEVALQGDECDHEGAPGVGAKVRCFGARIKSLNSVLMSYLGGDDDLTLGEANSAYTGLFSPFKPQETTHA